MTEPVQALRDGEPVIAVGIDADGYVRGAQTIHPEDVDTDTGPMYEHQDRLADHAERIMCDEGQHFAYELVALDEARRRAEVLGYCLVQAHDGDGHPDGLTGAMHKAMDALQDDQMLKRDDARTDLAHAYEAVTGEEVDR